MASYDVMGDRVAFKVDFIIIPFHIHFLCEIEWKATEKYRKPFNVYDEPYKWITCHWFIIFNGDRDFYGII